MGTSPVYVIFLVLVNAFSYSGGEHILAGRASATGQDLDFCHWTQRVRSSGIDSPGISCLESMIVVSKRRFACFHRAIVPQRLLTRTFGHQHSGNTRTPRRERPLRVASVRRDPILAAPGSALSTISSP